MHKQIITGALFLLLFQLSAAGVLDLICYRAIRYNGTGYHLQLPTPVTQDTASFQCEATIAPVRRLPNHGLRAALLLSENPNTPGDGSCAAAIEFYKGISKHITLQHDKTPKQFDNWGRFTGKTPVHVKISWDKKSSNLVVSYSSGEEKGWSKTISLKDKKFTWKYFSLVSFRPSGDQVNVKDRCRITDFKINGQELQFSEFRTAVPTAPVISANDPELQKFLNDQVRPKLPVPGEPLFNTLNWKFFPHNNFDYAKYEIIKTPEKPFPTVLRMTGLKRPKAFHSVQIASRRNEKPICKGDVIFIQFDARCLASSDESGDGYISMLMVEDNPTWSDWGGASAHLTREWQRFYGCAIAKRDMPAGKVRLQIYLSHRQQTVEIGGIALLNLGQYVDIKKLPSKKLVYKRPSAEWRKQANERIEKIRKGTFQLTIRDKNNKTLSNIPVSLKMRRHAFGFGCYADDAPLLRTDKDGQIFREHFLSLFNRAIVPMFWGPGNATNKRYGWENPFSRNRYEKIAQWCAEHNLDVQAHVLTWPSSMYVPPEVAALKSSPAKLQARTIKHIEEVIAANGKNVHSYQVLNEPCATREFMDVVGMKQVAEWFKAARKAAPGKPLLINDNGQLSIYKDKQADYEAIIAELLSYGVPIDQIGFQGHIGSAMPSPEILWQTLDRFHKRFGKPIHITEFTAGIPDEALQAEYTGDFLLAIFSHPAVEAVTFWGFWEGKHYAPYQALYRKNWQEKPNGAVFRKLVHETWQSNANGTTDKNGVFQAKLFYGDYDAEFVLPDGKKIMKKISFRPNSKTAAFTL